MARRAWRAAALVVVALAACGAVAFYAGSHTPDGGFVNIPIIKLLLDN